MFPASAKTCASQTADVVLPVPGLRLTKATLRAVIKAVSQYAWHCGKPPPTGRVLRTRSLTCADQLVCRDAVKRPPALGQVKPGQPLGLAPAIRHR